MPEDPHYCLDCCQFIDTTKEGYLHNLRLEAEIRKLEKELNIK